MNLPAIANNTFLSKGSDPFFAKIVKQITKKIKKLSSPSEKVSFIHKEIDKRIEKLFENPLVTKHVSCRKGCGSCCHSQVSVTIDEALVLAEKVLAGQYIDMNRLQLQSMAGNDETKWYSISTDNRKCVFLNNKNECTVYDIRPSVCRTNHVVSNPAYCSTEGGTTRSVQLLKTHEADMVVVSAFSNSVENGTLPYMLLRAITNIKSIHKPILNQKTAS